MNKGKKRKRKGPKDESNKASSPSKKTSHNNKPNANASTEFNPFDYAAAKGMFRTSLFAVAFFGDTDFWYTVKPGQSANQAPSSAQSTDYFNPYQHEVTLHYPFLVPFFTYLSCRVDVEDTGPTK